MDKAPNIIAAVAAATCLIVASAAVAQSTTGGSGTSTTAPAAPSTSQVTPGVSPDPKSPPASLPGRPRSATAPSAAGVTTTDPVKQATTGNPLTGKTDAMSGTGPTLSNRLGTQEGEASDRVRDIQRQLQTRGMDPGPIDGVMGPRTETALKNFQRDQKLSETGRVDPETLEKLGVPKQ